MYLSIGCHCTSTRLRTWRRRWSGFCDGCHGLASRGWVFLSWWRRHSENGCGECWSNHVVSYALVDARVRNSYLCHGDARIYTQTHTQSLKVNE